MGRRGRVARGIRAWWGRAVALLLRGYGRGLCGCGFDDRGERVGGDEAHEEEGLEDGVGQLWGLLEEFGGFARVG